jgi:hypothetical protein
VKDTFSGSAVIVGRRFPICHVHENNSIVEVSVTLLPIVNSSTLCIIHTSSHQLLLGKLHALLLSSVDSVFPFAFECAASQLYLILLIRRCLVLILAQGGQVAARFTIQRAKTVARMILFAGETVKGGTSQ